MLEGDLKFDSTFSRREVNKYQIGSTGTWGVLKTRKGTPIREVLAYKLDRLLGLNIVPLTVYREDPDSKLGSLQYFMKSAREHESAVARTGEKPIDFYGKGYPKEQSKMWLLDFLLGNTDRHGRNWFTYFGNQSVAIDHGDTLEGGRAEVNKMRMNKENLPGGKLLERLARLTPEDFKEFDIDTDKIFIRRDEVLQAVSKKTGKACNFYFKKGDDAARKYWKRLKKLSSI